MTDLSLFILDLVQNSIYANSSFIQIVVNENIKKNQFSITIIDNGDGIEQDSLSQVTDPFYTTRTTRKVGLGIPLFKELCEFSNGRFQIISKPKEKTMIIGAMQYDHIDRLPLGKIEETIFSLFINSHKADIQYIHIFNEKKFKLDTIEIKSILGEVPINNYDVMKWIKTYIIENLKIIYEEL